MRVEQWAVHVGWQRGMPKATSVATNQVPLANNPAGSNHAIKYPFIHQRRRSLPFPPVSLGYACRLSRLPLRV